MTVRPEAVHQRLLKLEEVISGLETLRESSVEGEESFRDEWSIERGLQLGAEILLDIGNHLISAHYGASSSDYEDVLQRLEHHGVLPGDLRERLKGLGGFRNILVHAYLKLDREIVREHLDRAPEIFTAFAEAIRAWMTEHDL